MRTNRTRGSESDGGCDGGCDGAANARVPVSCVTRAADPCTLALGASVAAEMARGWSCGRRFVRALHRFALRVVSRCCRLAVHLLVLLRLWTPTVVVAVRCALSISGLRWRAVVGRQCARGLHRRACCSQCSSTSRCDTFRLASSCAWTPIRNHRPDVLCTARAGVCTQCEASTAGSCYNRCSCDTGWKRRGRESRALARKHSGAPGNHCRTSSYTECGYRHTS